MSEADIQAWLKQFNENSSPAEIKSAAETGLHMLDTRLGNIAESYNRGMNLKQPVSAESLLDAKSKEIHDRLLAGNPSDAQQNAVPPPAERRVGQIYQTPGGPARWLGNGQWQVQ